VPGALTTASTGVTVVTGLLLLLVAHALGRRKRRAWRLTVALLAGSVVLHVLKGLDVEEAVVAAALLALLLYLRDDFQAAGDPRTRWRALAVVRELVVADLALGLLVLALRDADGSFVDRLHHVVLGLVGVSGPVMFATGRDDDVVSAVLGALGVLTVLLPAYLALGPADPAAGRRTAQFAHTVLVTDAGVDVLPHDAGGRPGWQ
jgi:lysyl-tRNA synthetase class 2